MLFFAIQINALACIIKGAFLLWTFLLYLNVWKYCGLCLFILHYWIGIPLGFTSDLDVDLKLGLGIGMGLTWDWLGVEELSWNWLFQVISLFSNL